MMTHFAAAAVDWSGPYSPEAAARAAGEIRAQLGRPASVAFVFADSSCLPHLADFCETLRVDGHITHVVGSTCVGRIFGDKEVEDGAGTSILALACETGDPIELDGEAISPPRGLEKPNAWVVLGNPYSFAADEWLQEWNAAYPSVPCMGGLASGVHEEGTAVFLNGRTVDAVVVPFTGRTHVIPVISQGCRPIGEPLTVTRAENNVVYALGGQPAYHVLESAFESLSDEEKSNARGNLFAGLAGNEYVEEFKSGDFLIRNIIGADPDSGAVVIAGIPRTGQTLQYQLRDRNVAGADLERALKAAPMAGRRNFASLLFSCLGRGEKFFGVTGHDAKALSQATGGKPSAGFFCNGELGPVAGRNALHSYTAAAAIWIERTP